MTNAEKLASPKRLFIFHRADGFYPLELPEATVAENAECNPGTLRVEDAQTGEVVWHNVPDQAREDENVADTTDDLRALPASDLLGHVRSGSES